MFYSKDALSMDALNMDGKYGMIFDVCHLVTNDIFE